jgi:hypothetical protein
MTRGSFSSSPGLELQRTAGKIPAVTTETVKDPEGNETTREVPIEIPQDPTKIRNLWHEQLPAIRKNGKTVIVIDAVNQLDTGIEDLMWLPLYGLPENVKLVVSFREDAEGARELLERLDANLEDVRVARVKPFGDLEDRRRLINAYLSQYLKEIDATHLEEIVATEGAGNLLLLKVVLSELRVFGSFAGLAEKIRSEFGDSPVSAFTGTLRRLENDPAYSPILPMDAVPLLFGLMAHARYGLSAEELAAMLLQVLELEQTEERRSTALETVHLFLRQVRPFLARRDGRFDFFFESFKNAAIERYVTGSTAELAPKRTAQEWHRLLAHYFIRLPLWVESRPSSEHAVPSYRKPMLRKVAELPYHETQGELWSELEETLTDLFFIEGKCVAGMPCDLVADYNSALDTMPEAQEQKRQDLEREARTARYTRAIIAYAGAWNDARARYAADPENNPLPEPEDIPLQEIIPAFRPWTDVEIHADTQSVCHIITFTLLSAMLYLRHGERIDYKTLRTSCSTARRETASPLCSGRSDGSWAWRHLLDIPSNWDFATNHNDRMQRAS